MKSSERLSYAALKVKFLFCELLSRETGLQRSEHSLKNKGKIENIIHSLQTRQANKPLLRIVQWATKVQILPLLTYRAELLATYNHEF